MRILTDAVMPKRRASLHGPIGASKVLGALFVFLMFPDEHAVNIGVLKYNLSIDLQ